MAGGTPLPANQVPVPTTVSEEQHSDGLAHLDPIPLSTLSVLHVAAANRTSDATTVDPTGEHIKQNAVPRPLPLYTPS